MSYGGGATALAQEQVSHNRPQTAQVMPLMFDATPVPVNTDLEHCSHAPRDEDGEG